MKIIYFISGCLLTVLIIYLFSHSSPEIRNSVPSSDIILCFGDSLTYGTGAEKGMDYPSRLSRVTRREVINAGVPGDTTAFRILHIKKNTVYNPP